METTSLFMDPLFVHNGAASVLPAGIVGWSDMGALVVWFVVVAFIGSLFGILRNRTEKKLRPRVIRRPRVAHREVEQPA